MWYNDRKLLQVGTKPLILRVGQPVEVKFLSNGEVVDYELEGKMVKRLLINVEVEGETLSMSLLSKQAMQSLAALSPLQGKTVSVLKEKVGRSSFDVEYSFEEVTKPKK